MPSIAVRWSDNTADLKKHLSEGLNQIEATAAGADRLVRAFSGEKLIAAAHNQVAALEKLGGAMGALAGVEKLTAGEKERINALITKAIEKYTLLGQTAPTALHQIAAATKAIPEQLTLVDRATGLLTSTFGQMLGAFSASSLINKAVGTLSQWTTEAIKSAGVIVDLASKTGNSMEMIQRWGFVAEHTSTTMEAFTTAAFKLGVNLSGGSGSVRAAVASLGLSFADLMKLNPDQQFDKIARALEGMADPQERNRIGMLLFGKQFAEIVPSIEQGYAKLADAANVSSDLQLKALDRASERWDEFVAHQKNRITQFLGDQVAIYEQSFKLTTEQRKQMAAFEEQGGSAADFMLQLAQAEDAAAERAKQHAKETAKQTAVIIPFTQELAAARKEMAAITPDTRAQILAAQELGKSTDEITDRFGVSAVAQRMLADATRQQTDAAKKAAEENKKWQESLHFLGVNNPAPEIRQLAIETLTFGKTLDVSDEPMLKFGGSLEHVAAVAAVAAERIKAAEKRAREFAEFNVRGVEAPSSAAGLGDLDWMLGQAKGGGASLFSKATDFFKNGAGQIGKGFLQGLGGILSGGISSLVSAGLALAMKGLGKLWGGIKNLFGGPSAGELQTRKLVDDFTAGLSQTLTAEQKAEAGASKFNQTVVKVRDAFVATGRTAAAGEAAVKRLFDAKTPEAYKRAVDEINTVLDEQKRDEQEHADDIARAKELIDEYKLSVDQLGPAWRNQQLKEQADGLMNDFRIMVDVLGMDVPTAIGTMKDKLIDYANTAARTGTDVPASMRPILQGLIDQGLWLDKNGQAFTDLSQTGVLFGSPLERGLDRIVDRLDKLLEGLGLIPRAAEDAANQVPDNPFADWGPPDPGNWNPKSGEDRPMTSATGGLVTPGGIQHFVGGGRVLPFFPRRIGTDTVPAMLTPGELVLNESQQHAVGALVGAGLQATGTGGGGTLIIRNVLDGRVLSETVIKDFHAAARRLGII